jgi:hypothetical protein
MTALGGSDKALLKGARRGPESTMREAQDA